MHNNMFQHGHTRQEVRQALNNDHKRSHKYLQILDVIFSLCLLFLVRHLPTWDIVAVMVAATTGVSGMRYFIDQSVRNFYLHRLDWEENKEDPSNG